MNDSMKRLSVVAACIAVLLAVSCKHKEAEPALKYYTTPNSYDIVSVEAPAADAEIRNIIFMIGDGMGLEQVS